MKLATWNVNSIRSRQDRLIAWLARHEPDVLCLQELKVTDEVFDPAPIEAAGYHVTMLGQKAYNGVGIVSRSLASNIVCNMDDGVDDPQARLIAGTFGEVAVVNLYVPNGSEVGSDKWDYKLAWLSRLTDWLDAHYTPDQPLIICGDFNIAPTDADMADPEAWADSVLCHPLVRDALTRLLDWGLTDVFATHYPEGGIYSWWDYRHLAFPKDRGMRIDLVLATAGLATRCTNIEVDRDERKGEKPSDHAPVVATFDVTTPSV
jgi:exodeoxyribonuclease III